MRAVTSLPPGRAGGGSTFAAALSLAIVAFAGTARAATWTVTSGADGGPGSLRDTIAAAASGDTIVFAVFGTITLTSGELAIEKDLDIEGPGATLLAVSGNDASRIFHVRGGATATIAGLTLTRGRATVPVGGGAVLNLSSTTILRDDVFSFNNNAEGSGPFAPCDWNNPKSAGLFNPAWGGAVSNIGGPPQSASCPRSAATLVVTDCAFLFNQARGAFSKGAEGGAICNHAGTATVSGCFFLDNKALGGNGGTIDPSKTTTFICFALGGAIVNRAGSTMTVTDSTFVGNLARGGNDGSGGAGASDFLVGSGAGGGIFNHDTSTLVLGDCAFIGNQAIGGSNDAGGASGFGEVATGDGGALNAGGTTTITRCIFDHNQARGGNGNVGGGGDVLVGGAAGGAISAVDSGGTVSLSMSDVTFSGNEAIGGAGNAGGPGNALAALTGFAFGGGLANRLGATATVRDGHFWGNRAVGASGGSDGCGGGIANFFGSALSVSLCTLQYNEAAGGGGDASVSGGDGLGGGIFNDGLSSWPVTAGAPATVNLCGSSITRNQATAGRPGGNADGGGVYLTPGGMACADASVIIGNAPDDIGGTGAWSAGCSPCP
jgi:hypothetical protein